ncbi:MAG: glycosyltransferase family 4 protein [Oligoflexales bacterium]
MNILTFNHHESYIRSLAGTGHNYELIVARKGLDLSWNSSSGPIPANVTLVNFDEQVRKKLRKGFYSLVICHTVKNLFWMFFYFKPRYIFIAHIPLFFDSPLNRLKSISKRFMVEFFEAFHKFNFVAVSEFKRKKWDKKGTTIVLTPQEIANQPDLERFASKKLPPVIVVANKVEERKEELGFKLIEKINSHFPVLIIGNNEGLENAIRPNNHSEFAELFSKGKVYLYTIKQPFGDGYNTAMLEAMSLGIPVVTVENPSSPIRHDINGLIGRDVNELIRHIGTLLKNEAKRQFLGLNAKATIEQKFSHTHFVSNWKNLIESVG